METNGILFIEQSVKAMPSFSEADNLQGTVVDHAFKMDLTNEKDGVYSVLLRVFTDMDESENPPYEFSLEAIMLIKLSDDEANEENLPLARRMAFQMLFASIRERLASITARGVWDTFHLGPFPYSKFEESLNQGDETFEEE